MSHFNDDDYTQTIRPALVNRLAADTGRNPDEIGRILDQLEANDWEHLDPATVIETFLPTARTLNGALGRAQELPDEERIPALMPIVSGLVPAVTQAVLHVREPGC